MKFRKDIHKWILFIGREVIEEMGSNVKFQYNAMVALIDNMLDKCKQTFLMLLN